MAATHVHGRYFRGSVLEQAVGEPAGRRSDVERARRVPDGEGEPGQGRFELVSTASLVAVAGEQLDRVDGADLAAGFVGGVARDPDLAGEDRALRFPALAQAAVDEQLIHGIAGAGVPAAGARERCRNERTRHSATMSAETFQDGPAGEVIRAEIAAHGGAIPFARFMELALSRRGGFSPTRSRNRPRGRFHASVECRTGVRVPAGVAVGGMGKGLGKGRVRRGGRP